MTACRLDSFVLFVSIVQSAAQEQAAQEAQAGR
jgi:hypothetical protein